MHRVGTLYNIEWDPISLVIFHLIQSVVTREPRIKTKYTIVKIDLFPLNETVPNKSKSLPTLHLAGL